MNSILINNEERMLGCLPREAPVGSVCPTFASALPMIPREEWKPVDWSYLIKLVLNQSNLGACVGFSGSSTQMALRTASGLPHVELSGGHLYGLVNKQRDAGAYLSDSIVALKNTGICPVSAVPQLSWKMNTWPNNWKELARENRALEAYDCNTFTSMAVAAQRGFITSFGIAIGNNFETDSEGYIPPMGRSVGGHAITCVGLHYGRNAWWLRILNSWTARWGIKGYGFVPESYFRGNFVDGWALRAIQADSSL